MTWTTVKIADREMEVEYEFDITHSGNSGSYWEPPEPAEYNIEIFSLRFPHTEANLELPKWLKELLEQHLCEDREDINDIIQKADMERDYFEDDQ